MKKQTLIKVYAQFNFRRNKSKLEVEEFFLK